MVVYGPDLHAVDFVVDCYHVFADFDHFAGGAKTDHAAVCVSMEELVLLRKRIKGGRTQTVARVLRAQEMVGVVARTSCERQNGPGIEVKDSLYK